MQKLRKFLFFCAGAESTILEQAPMDKEKITSQGLVVLLTGILAMFSGGYALYIIFRNWIPAVAFGIFWGIMIFNLDRYLLSSMRKRGGRKEFLQVLPRFMLALLLAMIIARPIEWKIFESEIKAEWNVMLEETRLNTANAVNNRYQKNLDNLNAERTTLMEAIKEARQRMEYLQKEAMAEADGTGGSKIRNLGPIYKIKLAASKEATARYDSMNKSYTRDLYKLDKAIAGLRTERDSVTKATPLVLLPGPASNEAALERLSNQQPAIALARIFVFLLFVVLELMPVLVKWITPAGQYDFLLLEAEHKTQTEVYTSIAKTTSTQRETINTLHETDGDFLTRKLNNALP